MTNDMKKAQYEKKKARLATPEGRRRHNAYMKEYHRQKVLAAGREYKPRRPKRVLSIAQLVTINIPSGLHKSKAQLLSPYCA